MAQLTETYTLNNGVKIPRLGLGTWFISDEKAAEAVRLAIAAGYRHIDTAQAYGNERGVGEGIRTSGIPRREIFLTTKLAAEIKDRDEAARAIDRSLATLGLDYIDLMIIHSPQPWAEFRSGEHYEDGNLAAWQALEEAYNAGKIKAIGVSNFEAADLDNILRHGTVKPAVNQILCHAGNTPFGLISHCQRHGILVEAYSPIGHGEMLRNPQLIAIAARYRATVAQLCIRYCLQLGLLPLPKTSSPARMTENAAVDFQISPDDMAALRTLTPIPDYGPASIFPVFGGRKDSAGNYQPGTPHRG